MSLWLEPASSISGFLTDDDFNAEVLESGSKRVDLVDFASFRSPPTILTSYLVSCLSQIPTEGSNIHAVECTHEPDIPWIHKCV